MALTSKIYVINVNEEVVAVLSNDVPEACPFYNDILVDQLDGLNTLEFNTPLDHDDTEWLTEENQVAVRREDGDYMLFRIKKTEEVRSPGRGYRYVYCEAAHMEILDAAIVAPTTYSSKTLEYILDDLLTNLRWELRYCEDDDTSSFTWHEHVSRLKAIYDIIDHWAMEFKWSVIIEKNKVSQWVLDVLVQRGTDNGKRIEYSKDMRGVRRVVDSTGLYTALVGIGATNKDNVQLTFKDVVAGDKPAGQIWVGDDDALALYGVHDGAGGKTHRFGIYRDSSQENATALLDATRAALQEVKSPKYTYEIDTALLEKVPQQYAVSGTPYPYLHEAVRLGDTVYVKDMTLKPYLALEARVISIESSQSDPKHNKVVLGEFRPLIVDSVDPSDIERSVWLYAGEWAQDTVGRTFVVAASDSIEPARADYECDGTDDDVEIQEAIDAAASIGGTVMLLEGTFSLGADLILEPGVAFEGMGHKTIIETNGYEIGPGWLSTSDIQWRNMVIDATGETFWTFYIYDCTGGLIENVHFLNGATALIIQNATAPVLIRACVFDSYSNAGISIDSSSDVVVDNCIFKDVDNYAVSVRNNSDDCVIQNCLFKNCGGSGATQASIWLYCDQNGWYADRTNITNNAIRAHASAVYSIFIKAPVANPSTSGCRYTTIANNDLYDSPAIFDGGV